MPVSAGRPKATQLLAKVERLLASKYRTPRLGNKRHPVSELVFIILSARTRGRNHEAAYADLRRRFSSWNSVCDANVRQIAAVIHDAGLGRIKARQIKGLLARLRADFGTLSGRGLREIPTADLERYLTSLPGVGLKTARCVLMYSLDRKVFPVDIHCMRLLDNLGLIEGHMRFEYIADIGQDLVPPKIRYSLHVNTVAHGRRTCVPGAERCDQCPIANLCRNRHTVGEGGRVRR